MAPRHDIRSYQFENDRKYFLDTNILLAVYGPFPPEEHRAKIYSGPLKRLRAAGVPAFFDVLVASEFVNVWARYEFKIQDFGGDFKAFRASPEFQRVAKDIAQALRSILTFVRPSPTPFANIDLLAKVDEFETARFDFNDLMVEECCRSRSYILVTDDGDFGDADVSIVTGNRELLGK